MFKDKNKIDIEKFDPHCNENGCDVNIFQDLDVCVPITVEPFVKLHEAEVECIDEPYIVSSPNNCKNKNGTCRFNLAQKLCIMIPIEFKAKTTSGPTSVICGDISDEDCPSFICGENEEEDPEKKNPFNFYIRGRRIE
jgi:hypothetical protein